MRVSWKTSEDFSSYLPVLWKSAFHNTVYLRDVSKKHDKLEEILALGRRELIEHWIIWLWGHSSVPQWFESLSLVSISSFFSDSAQESAYHSVVVEFLAQRVLNVSWGICMSPPSKPSTFGVHFVLHLGWSNLSLLQKERGFFILFSVFYCILSACLSYLCSNKAASACRTHRKWINWVGYGLAIIGGKKRGPSSEGAVC